MLSHLDCVIFPDRCEVVEVVPSQRYVYPIYKNGRSSLLRYSNINRCKIIFNEQIKKVHTIDVVLRDPNTRFVSGINTFVQTILRDHPDLDPTTVTWFTKNYLFLNRHYSPQYTWLLNLARYLDSGSELRFFDMQEITVITGFNEKPDKIEPVNDQLLEQIKSISNNEMYERIDKVLMELIGRTMTFSQVVNFIKHKDSAAYDFVIGRSQRIMAPLNALS
jgi:hypothetical protein